MQNQSGNFSKKRHKFVHSILVSIAVLIFVVVIVSCSRAPENGSPEVTGPGDQASDRGMVQGDSLIEEPVGIEPEPIEIPEDWTASEELCLKATKWNTCTAFASGQISNCDMITGDVASGEIEEKNIESYKESRENEKQNCFNIFYLTESFKNRDITACDKMSAQMKSLCRAMFNGVEECDSIEDDILRYKCQAVMKNDNSMCMDILNTLYGEGETPSFEQEHCIKLITSLQALYKQDQSLCVSSYTNVEKSCRWLFNPSLEYCEEAYTSTCYGR